MEEKEEWKNWSVILTDKEFKGFFQHFLSTSITRIEGFQCQTDKTRFINKKIREAFKTGENLSLYDEMEDSGKKAYWSPDSFKDIASVLTAFSSWYNLNKITTEIDLLKKIINRCKENNGKIELSNWEERTVLIVKTIKITKKEQLEKINSCIPVRVRKIKFSLKEDKFFTNSNKLPDLYFETYTDCINFINSIIETEKILEGVKYE